jgi:RNA polymerase sigma-70 factor, ECF subfamily
MGQTRSQSTLTSKSQPLANPVPLCYRANCVLYLVRFLAYPYLKRVSGVIGSRYEITRVIVDSEQQLLARVRARERRALAETFDRYYEPLYRYIYRHVGQQATAENLAAEVFRQLLEALRAGSGPRQYLRAWLYRVAHNLYVNELRHQSYRDDLPLDTTVAADGPDLDAAAQRALVAGHVQEALDQLTVKQREVIILKFLEGMSNEETAAVLDLEYGSVKALQHRALASMRRYLIRNGAMVAEEVDAHDIS